MPLTDVAPIEVTAEIEAPPAAVRAVVSDLRNGPRWSPPTAKSVLREENGLGDRFLNLNRTGLPVRPTRSEAEAERG